RAPLHLILAARLPLLGGGSDAQRPERVRGAVAAVGRHGQLHEGVAAAARGGRPSATAGARGGCSPPPVARPVDVPGQFVVKEHNKCKNMLLEFVHMVEARSSWWPSRCTTSHSRSTRLRRRCTWWHGLVDQRGGGLWWWW
ncbi:unnamed protein product, partial [Urochloa humidicola]